MDLTCFTNNQNFSAAKIEYSSIDTYTKNSVLLASFKRLVNIYYFIFMLENCLMSTTP